MVFSYFFHRLSLCLWWLKIFILLSDNVDLWAIHMTRTIPPTIHVWGCTQVGLKKMVPV